MGKAASGDCGHDVQPAAARGHSSSGNREQELAMRIHGPCERAQAARPRSVIRHVCLAGAGRGSPKLSKRGWRGELGEVVASVLTNCARAAIKKGGAEAELAS